VTPSITRVSDLMAPFYNLAIGTCEMTGAELAGLARKAAAESEPRLYVEPAEGVDLGKLEPARIYRVALPVDLLWTLSGLVQPAPRNYAHTDLLVSDALERYLTNN
jgi:hypothetical protein